MINCHSLNSLHFFDLGSSAKRCLEAVMMRKNGMNDTKVREGGDTRRQV